MARAKATATNTVITETTGMVVEPVSKNPVLSLVEKEATQVAVRNEMVIAVEINMIKESVQRVMLESSVAIGKRLIEAKSMVGHGEWGKWLEESVDYSQSTANNLMKVAREYGEQIELPDGQKSQALENLSYTAAVALLSLPEEKRTEFVENNDVEKMSSRELQKAIKAKNDAEKALAEIEKKNKEHEKHIQDMQAKVQQAQKLEAETQKSEDALKTMQEEYVKEVTDLKEQIAKAEKAGNQKEVEKLQGNLKDAQKQVGNYEKQLEVAKKELEKLRKEISEKPKEKIVEVVPDAVQKEMEEMKAQIAKLTRENNKIEFEFKHVFDSAVGNLEKLVPIFQEISVSDPDKKEKYKKAIMTVLDKVKSSL